MQDPRIVVVGAGIGGLSAALRLAAAGCDVTLVERSDAPGGKMREVLVGSAAIDAGPTVFTMRWVFDELLHTCGANLDDIVTLHAASTLARHAWDDTARLDLFADPEQSADAMGRFAGSDAAAGFRHFCAAARQTYLALERTFLAADRPSMPGLVGRLGVNGLRQFTQASPFATLWSELGRYFPDPRLRQLFGRYATYVGSSPFSAPATLMLIAHVEQDGVWLVEGGMHRLSRGLAMLCERKGARIRFGCDVAAIENGAAGATGVVLQSGERIAAEAVVFNGDVLALENGLLGDGLRRAVPDSGGRQRSLSAMTWAKVARTEGWPMARHTVLFSADSEREFDRLFSGQGMPEDPTVYICAQDRDDGGDLASSTEDGERLLCLINAPAIRPGSAGAQAGSQSSRSGSERTDSSHYDAEEIEQCHRRMVRRLAACGLSLQSTPERSVVTTPQDFARLFPASQGALYGQASHGWMAAFQRPRSRARIPGLYLAGGSAHPGAGVPMAAISGRLAAEALLADLISRRRFHPVAIAGGTSTG